jgi:hypothetical protein
MPAFLRQVEVFTQYGVPRTWYTDPEQGDDNPLDENVRCLRLPQPDFFRQYHNMSCANDCKLEDGEFIPFRLEQLDFESWMRLSQLNMSKHSYWVDGSHTTNLSTNVEIDQFIFVEDADPAFWSEKNPRETDIWIRMRPFAFSLNGDTLKFFVREIYTVDDVHYDTGYYDVIDKYGWPPNNERVTLEYFDAGGGALGIEFTYDPPERFHHNALVYVHIELYDTAAEPNFITTSYWFKVIPDYKSPYLENENPAREQELLPLNPNIEFDLKDDGEGVDIETLEVYLNSRLVYHGLRATNPASTINEISVNHYEVSISLPYELQYGKTYSVGVIATDLSENRNILRDSYRFHTRPSEVPWFVDFDPDLCRRGMHRFRDVSFIVLGAGNGVDKETIRIQVHDKDVTNQSKIAPIIYRVS